MPQDFSGQKLYGRSFVGQDLKGANFEKVEIKRPISITLIASSNEIFFVSLISGFLLHVAAFRLTGLINMLFQGSDYIEFPIIDGRVSFTLLVVNAILLLTLMMFTFWGKFKVFLKLIVYLLLIVVGIAVVVFLATQIGIPISKSILVHTSVFGAIAGAGAIGIGVITMLVSIPRSIFGTSFVGVLIILGLIGPTIMGDSGIGSVAINSISITIINFLLIAAIISSQADEEDPQFYDLRLIRLKSLLSNNGNFNRADLTEASFYKANLKYANFADAILIRTNFRKAQNLKFAYVENTILEQKAVRKLLVNGGTTQTDFKQMDLHGAYLVEANLRNIDFTDANFNQADLSGANLQNANLTRVQAIGTDFENTDLTGVCLEAWQIDATTNIKNVQADYVYLKNNQQERCPSSGKFSEGEFEKFLQSHLQN